MQVVSNRVILPPLERLAKVAAGKLRSVFELKPAHRAWPNSKPTQYHAGLPSRTISMIQAIGRIRSAIRSTPVTQAGT